jgi:lipopolysaccharide/colanic/teichoic acid biosynthesis glycosyltransferase
MYRNYGKRLIDAILSLMALLILSPLLLLVGMLVKWTSRGPILYWQERVGRDGHIFRIAKFRSMVANADRQGLGITVSGDIRVTGFGSFLRMSKIDELPQLWNVLTGKMSLVGPRPELPQYVSQYTPEQRRVLSVRPGVTDLASIRYRHEEAILAGSDDPEQFYRRVVLPDKLALNLQYVRDMSLPLDIRLVIQTITSLFKAPIKVTSEHALTSGTSAAELAGDKNSRGR